MKRKLSSPWAYLLWLLLLLPSLSFAEELSSNLITDGGVEQWKEISPDGTAGSWWNYLTVGNKATELTRLENGNVLKPDILGLLMGAKMLKVENADVHGGKKALRLNGQIYLAASGVPEAYKTKDGEVYVIRYWAKGEGDTGMEVHVYGEGRAETIEIKGKPTKDKWSLIEKRVKVTGSGPTTILPRLCTSEEMLIDDIFMARVLPEGERKLTPIASDCQERVAFATETVGTITIDGRLDEPEWGQAIPFGGFRFLGDQNLLAVVQLSFRVLFNAQTLFFGIEIPLANARQVLDELNSKPLLDKEQPRSKADSYTSRDSIELFFQAAGKSGYFQFVVSLDGYRYDGKGTDGAWNGNWEYAITAVDDRWFLEMRIPAPDLGIERFAPPEGWRMNLVCNQASGVSTWAAVGDRFHNPAAFGKLLFQDFVKWKEQQPALRTKKKAEILAAAGPRRAIYAERLDVADAFLPIAGQSNGKAWDWESVTRTYTQIDNIGYTYRCAEEEVRYANLFTKENQK